ncbi:MAG: dTDP-4-dehydrorhamnose reductase [Pseudomonadota bacterium]|nr:dTDP-4-dehydrorhamnose reductase [Pseudomonadota bacterium]
MKILLTGIHGQVGFELLRSLEPLGELIPADRTMLDLTRPDQIRDCVRAVRPDLIVNPAAYTAVDRAEQEADLCHAINATAVGVLGEEAERLGAGVVHYSTDYVFDGSGTQPWQEDAPTGPLNVYGASKLAGERLLAATCSQHLILRTSWVYGMRGSNFLLTMLRLSQERPSLRIVADQFGAPTWCRHIADTTAALIALHVTRQEGRTRQRCNSGVLHLCNGGATSWAGFAREIFRVAGRDTLVEDIPASAYPTPARRPANSRLDCTQLEQLLGVPMEPWQLSLERCLKGQ